MTPTLFEEIVGVAARYLGRSVAPFTVSRLLIRAGIFDREALSVADARRALPHLRAGLGEFLTAEELQATIDQMTAVISRRDGQPEHVA